VFAVGVTVPVIAPDVPVTVTIPDTSGASPRFTVAVCCAGFDATVGAYCTTTLHIAPTASAVPQPPLPRLKLGSPLTAGASVNATFPVFVTTAAVCVADPPTS
jgi:hypothetical protein